MREGVHLGRSSSGTGALLVNTKGKMSRKYRDTGVRYCSSTFGAECSIRETRGRCAETLRTYFFRKRIHLH